MAPGWCSRTTPALRDLAHRTTKGPAAAGGRAVLVQLQHPKSCGTRHVDAVGPDPAGAPRTNRQVEDAGLRCVIDQEALAGRIATDTRGKRAAGDLTSGDRVVEVKAYGGSARGQDVWLEVRQIEEARSNPDFWLYLVENILQGDPAQFRLLRVGGQPWLGC